MQSGKKEMFFVVVEDSNISDVLKVVQTDECLDLFNQNTAEKTAVVLTERERAVLKLIIEGKSNAEIAKLLIISVHTAKAHVCSILQKLCVTDRVQAAVKAVREKIV